ncbi:hypothetical protein [Streptomyces sp. NPDC001100]
MPEMYFDVRRPDGLTQRYCSPSTTAENYFVPGVAYGDVSGAEVTVEALLRADGSTR